jgi:GntR family transcriptional regulator
VSRITVRRALQTLESEGLIYRRQGLGSFVRGSQVRQGLVRLTDFIEDMSKAGLEASSEVILFDRESAPADVAAALQVEPGTPVTRLDRLRLGDGLPIAFDRTWLPLFYGQLLEGHDLHSATIYRILENDYQIPVLRGRYRIEAVAAPGDVAGPLQVPSQAPLLCILRVSYTVGDRPIYFQQRYYRSDRVAYELELAREPGSSADPGKGMPLREFEPVFKIKG